MIEAKVNDADNISEETMTIDPTTKPIASEKHGTVLAGYTVITKSMIGAGMFTYSVSSQQHLGMFGMAFGCSQFGLPLGIFFLFLAALITWLSIRVLAVLALDYKETTPTFYSVSNELIPKFKWLIDVALIINCFGGVVAYVQVFGNLLADGLWGVLQWDENALSISSAALIIQACILIVLAPLCMMKEISSTKIANMIGLGCIAYIIGMTFFYVPCTAAKDDFGALLKPASVLVLFSSFPTFIFSFACQQNIFTVANELKDANMQKLNRISMASVSTGLLVYLPVMVLPFLTFGSKVVSPYLTNLKNADGTVDIPVMIAYIFASLSVSISYVLLLQPIRCSIMSLAFGTNQPTGKKEKTYRISIVIGLMLASYGLAFALGRNLGLPIDIAGLLGGNTMCFVMPFILYLKKYGYNKKNKFSLAVMVTLIFCFILYPVCLTGIICREVSK
jgi:amino acid permease